MSEPTDVAPPDSYTFTRPEGLLAHYTKASTAFENILPGKLRLSPYRLMRDPAENKDILPNICSLRPAPDDDRAIEEVYAQIKAARNRMRVLSLTRDTEDGGDSYPEFDCCWSRPRMWEQYGDEHRGACLLFSKSCLERAICKAWPDERTRNMRNVVYKREGNTEIVRRGLNGDQILSADQILGEEHPARAVDDYIRTNSDAFFFLKSDDFATEWEYRVVLAAGNDKYAYLDYRDSLVGVVLGERFPLWKDPGAIKACEQVEVRLGWMHWSNGRPHVSRVRPREERAASRFDDP
jgi:hypothetical protein